MSVIEGRKVRLRRIQGHGPLLAVLHAGGSCGSELERLLDALHWQGPVFTVSAITREGLKELEDAVVAHLQVLRSEMPASKADAVLARREQMIPGLATVLDPEALVGALRTAVHRLRKRFGNAIREEIADTVADPEEAEAEYQELLGHG